jgi:hypothetical protein
VTKFVENWSNIKCKIIIAGGYLMDVSSLKKQYVINSGLIFLYDKTRVKQVALYRPEPVDLPRVQD